MYTIYLVEDDMNLNQILAYYLKQEGWQVSSFTDGDEARRSIQQKPDMWNLDI